MNEMQNNFQVISFFFITIILIILVLIPLFSAIQTGFDSTSDYYQESKTVY